MSALGPQFEQLAMPIVDENPQSVQDSNRLSVAYEQHRDTPAVELANNKGSFFAHNVPTPTPQGVREVRHLLHPRARMHEGNIRVAPRENYSHGGENQTVMGLPHEFNRTFTLDKHGNVEDPDLTYDDYHQHNPDMSRMHEAVWAEHAQTKMLPSKTILHTGQPASDTGDHAGITGPLDKNEPAAQVLVKKGVPILIDGHHRTAEWRGRGRSEFPARVLNLDQFGPEHPIHKQLAEANSDMNPEWL